MLVSKEHTHNFSNSALKGCHNLREMVKIRILFLVQRLIFSEGTELLTSESHVLIVSGVYEFQFYIIHVFGNSL